MVYGRIRYEQLPYKSTSILFYKSSYDKEDYVLLAYHPDLDKYSDFGGKIYDKKDQNFFQSAFRELLDELFGWKIIPYYFINELIYNLDKMMERETDRNIEIHIKDNVHVLIILTQEHLKRLLQLCRNTGRTSKYYDILPDNISDLIKKRKKYKTQQVSELKFFKFSSLPLNDVDPRTHQDLYRMNVILNRRYEHGFTS
jgi:hypothetical protein